MTEPSSLTLRTMMTEVTNVITTAGLRLSPSMFSAGATPKNLVDLSYVVSLQSKDTGKYRNGGNEILRMEHLLTVTVAKFIKPLDQFSSQLDAFDIQENVIKALSQSDAFAYARVDWVSTTPVVTPSREHLIINMVFRIEMDWSWSNGSV